MAKEEEEVSEWQAWRKKVDAALATLTGSRADDREKTEEEPPKVKAEDVEPPKKDAQPPKDKEEEPLPPKVTRGPLHKLIFG